MLSYERLPTKLTVTWQGCGVCPTPGLEHAAGPTHSRTVPLPAAFLAHLTAESEMRGGVPFLQTGADATDVISPETLYVEEGRLSLGEALEAGGQSEAERETPSTRPPPGLGGEHGRRVAQLLGVAAELIERWAAELPAGQRIAQLTLVARGFVPRRSHLRSFLTPNHQPDATAARAGARGPPQTAPPHRPIARRVGIPTQMEGGWGGVGCGVRQAPSPSSSPLTSPPPQSSPHPRSPPQQQPQQRCVVHIDVDSFYCAVEARDEPSLRGLPMAVLQSNAGGFVALSTEAKAAGLRKGDGVGARGREQIAHLREMRSIGLDEARRKCPGLVVRPMRTDRYREVAAEIAALLGRWGAAVERTSYDDFYLDVTELVRGAPAAALPARARIWRGKAAHPNPDPSADAYPSSDLCTSCSLAAAMLDALAAELQLPASAGVSRSKLAARMLSPEAKPAGLLVLADEVLPSFLRTRRLRDFPGLQQRRGRALAEAVRKASGAEGGEVTLGEALELGAPVLARTLSPADAQLVRELGEGGGRRADANVVERAQPKQLIAELSFPPNVERGALVQCAQGLATTLMRRVGADGRAPVKLLVSWRSGYENEAGLGGGGGGALRSASMPWPTTLRALSAGVAASTLAERALQLLDAQTPRPSRLTRLVLGAGFGRALPRACAAASLERFFLPPGGQAASLLPPGRQAASPAPSDAARSPRKRPLGGGGAEGGGALESSRASSVARSAPERLRMPLAASVVGGHGWVCSVCTYRHDEPAERSFLSCRICATPCNVNGGGNA